MTKALKTLRDFIESHKRYASMTSGGEAEFTNALEALDELDDHIDWIEKGNNEWRGMAQRNAQEGTRLAAVLRIAIGHLHSVLNQQHSADNQLKADTAARDWLISIGSEP